MKQYDYVIVGAGLFGATFAQKMVQRGKRCLVVDARPHIGGNIYTPEVDGIHVHQYGAHIFHTTNEYVWNYVNSLVPFNRFTNSPVAKYKGELYNLPFNMNTFHAMWGVVSPEEARAKIASQRYTGEVHNLEEQALSLVGEDIYRKLIKGYTEKQWGRDCRDLPAFIIRRLPLRFVYDNNYFNDPYQGIPIGGYNVMIEKMLQGCDIRLNCDYIEHRTELDALADCVLYTGPIDRFYDYRFGRLAYRTVQFDTKRIEVPNYQGNAVINYTDRETPWTRIIEHKHFESFGEEVYSLPHTIISHEYSIEWKPGMEPYYPINDEGNNRLFGRYRELAAQERNVLFGGRLADYTYYDMAPTIEHALELVLKVESGKWKVEQ